MNLDDAIRSRRAVRAYSGAPLDEATLRELIAATTMSPSASNEQNWRFTVIRDQAVLAAISAGAKQHVLDNAPPGGLPQRILDKLADPDFTLFHHAPALVVISSGPGKSAAENCSLAAATLMLAAREKGLGSCWIGSAQGFLQTDAGKAVIGVPPDHTPVAPIVLGHPKAWPDAPPRKEPAIDWIG